jgi:hypothetical protein
MFLIVLLQRRNKSNGLRTSRVTSSGFPRLRCCWLATSLDVQFRSIYLLEYIASGVRSSRVAASRDESTAGGNELTTDEMIIRIQTPALLVGCSDSNQSVHWSGRSNQREKRRDEDAAAAKAVLQCRGQRQRPARTMQC